MHSTQPDPRHSPEVVRRLRARARRTQVLRRRVGALALILLAVMWGAVYGLGSLGATSRVTVTAALADARTTTAATTSAVASHKRAASSKASATGATAHAAAVKSAAATTTATATTTTTSAATTTTAATTAEQATSTPATAAELERLDHHRRHHEPVLAHVTALATTGSHVFWITSRAAGIVALILTSASVGVGLSMSGRLVKGRGPDLRVTHEALAIAAIAAIALHGAALLGDSYFHPGIADLLIPFVRNYKEPYMALGIVAGWWFVVLGLSFYLRQRIGVEALADDASLHRAGLGVRCDPHAGRGQRRRPHMVPRDHGDSRAADPGAPGRAARAPPRARRPGRSRRPSVIPVPAMRAGGSPGRW